MAPRDRRTILSDIDTELASRPPFAADIMMEQTGPVAGTKDRWVIAYAAPHAGRGLGRDRIAEVLEVARYWAPPERTLVVVQEAERPWWSVLAAAFPPTNVIAEPFDRGSGTGVLAALLTIATRAPRADVAVVFGAMPTSATEAVDRALLRTRMPKTPVVFRGADERTPWPFAFATVAGWLARAEAVDRARVASLRMALARSPVPGAALDDLYPYLSSLDLEQTLLADTMPQRVVTIAQSSPSQHVSPIRNAVEARYA